jgi:protocatechuate 3,4-dioxygenase, alpha subunit
VTGDQVASGSQTIGPFFHVMPGCADGLACLVAADTPGERLDLRVRVLDGDGAAVCDALVEIWQADSSGAYVTVDADARGFWGFGRRATDDQGWAPFQTIRPGGVPDGHGAVQAPHINVLVFARGLLRHLYTRLYFEGDAALVGDPVLALVPGERRRTLLARRHGEAAWEFVIRLQGEHETVFFDV